MKLILTSEVAKLGLAGDIVEVKPGYGRNYLLPQGKAIAWTRGAETQIAGIQRARDARTVRDAGHAVALRDQIEALRVKVEARAADSGHLFGSISPTVIALAIKKAGGPAVDKRAVVLAKPIKTVGHHSVGVTLTDSVTARLSLEVVAAQ
ncbi:MAG: 50S ribosomal protein L9 [Propionibacteriaceae bacterium]|nr:50S ribosomal protein L9 [Propionibacteriaceae bacterium]